MNNELWANMYQQEHAIIYGRNVWHWLIDTAIGQIHVVQYESSYHGEIIEEVIRNSNTKAEKAFKRYCNKILKEQ